MAAAPRSQIGHSGLHLLLGAVTALALASGCYGALGGLEDDGAEAPAVASATRLRRLTHQEWESTVRDLLYLAEPSGLSQAFRDDPKQGGFLFANNGPVLNVDQALAWKYQEAAAALAKRVVNDAALLGQIAPQVGSTEQERAAAFVRNFGARAHRRPLSDAEVATYLALYERGLTSYDDQSGFGAGVRLTLEALLQSPFFLYRVEASTGSVVNHIPLDGYDRASRLSYFLWGSMPDAQLFEAAASGELDDVEGVRTQAERLLGSERAKSTAQEYLAGVLDVARYRRIAPSGAAFPGVSYDLKDFAVEETNRFAGDVVFAGGGGFRELLTSPVTYANAELARIYGLTGEYGSELVRVELDPKQRAGFLTQVGFLASHASSTDPDPIHRGVFVARRLACIFISAPPDAVPPLPEPGDLSNRQLVTQHTEDPTGTCQNCHSTVINPFGFTFEHYDAVGAFRTMDRNHPVDSIAAPPIDGENVEVKDAVDLAQHLAASPEVHECLTGYLVQFAHGRKLAREDEDAVAGLGQESLESGLSLREMMLQVAVSQAFLSRSDAAAGDNP